MYKIIIFCILIFSGCAIKEDLTNPNIQTNLSQNAGDYVSEFDSKIDKTILKELKSEYLDQYFSIWDKDFMPSPSDIMFWGLKEKDGYDESKRKIEKDFFENIAKTMDLENYPSMRQKAIMVKTANVRTLPTIKPRYSKIDGYPFDRWQNSLIFAFTPIIVLHRDTSKEWLLIQSSFVSGWVKSDEVAFVDKKIAKIIRKNRDFLLPLEDRIPLYHNNLFVQNARIGMLLEGKGDSIYIYQRDLRGYAKRIKIKIPKDKFSTFPLPPNQKSIANVADKIGVQNYGWGGMYELRDCSSFIRDIFANIGIWLPRNSLAQADFGKIRKNSKYMALPQDNEDKIQFIKEYAIPFRTIIWLKGHIMLYLGVVENEPIVMHAVWGVGSSDGIEILSRVSITTLNPKLSRIDIDNSSSSLLDRIKAINIIF
ncbi:MAG: SH3 domain-containing protein [Helicobacteraceae bacterium]|nr:SH3 domain-containing protein [Helicobacteraceae bacterium]